MSDLRNSPLDAVHRSLGARMVPFGGWDMPVSYPAGTIAEHMACREGAALFDVSHLGTLEVSGPGAFDILQNALSNDLRRIGPGRAQYTHLLDEGDASVLDDIIVWWLADERFWVLPNAANSASVVAALPGCRNLGAERALLALQGPDSRAVLGQVSPEAAAVGRFRVAEVAWDGTILTVAGTGYTGEDGVEVAVPDEAAAALWEAVTALGAEPAGLGARDTLRLEAGLPLHGHELGEGITPLDAGLGWVIGWDKDTFRGRTALLNVREAGPVPRLRGLSGEGLRPPREGQPVLHGGEQVSVLTSGNLSPVLGHGIGLAFPTAAV
nr:glycine cleavage system aminomethyltransferase GcvT [Actinomycetota bacterium]